MLNDTSKEKEIILSKSKMSNSALLLNDKRNGLSQTIDTIELVDMRFACDCPSWFDSLHYSRKFSDKSNLDKLNINSKNFQENCYYLEPAEQQLDLTSISFLPRTRVKVIGRKYNIKKIPSNNLLQDPNPITGNVFRYYGFEIIKPFMVYSNENRKHIENIEPNEKLVILTIK